MNKDTLRLQYSHGVEDQEQRMDKQLGVNEKISYICVQTNFQ